MKDDIKVQEDIPQKIKMAVACFTLKFKK